MSADSVGAAAEILQKLMASFAFLAAGIWVLMNYVRNRTHVARLQVEVKAEFAKRGDRHYLVVTCQAKNIGLSIVRLPKPEKAGVGRPGTVLLVRMLPQFAAGSYTIEAPWESETAPLEVFSNHDSIEPGLTISEQKLISLPDLDYDAFWVRLRVSAHREKWSAIVVAILKEDSGKTGLAPD